MLFLNHLQEELDLLEKEDSNSSSSSALVHCHDGGGRSGAFLAIFANLEKISRKDHVNVYESLKWLRTQRSGPVIANADQYRFVYDVLEDHVVCGDTQIDADKLKLQMAMLANNVVGGQSPATSSGGGSSSIADGFENEFRQLSAVRAHFSIGDCAAGHRPENRGKNRNPSVVPPDGKRPYLTSFQNTSDGDYINAVLIDSYTTSGAMIATEWPMPNTEANFWSMIYDHDVQAVVVLDPHSKKAHASRKPSPPPDHQHHASKRRFNRFWPTEGDKSNHYGGSLFSVELRGHSKFSDAIDAWNLRVKKLSLLSLR